MKLKNFRLFENLKLIDIAVLLNMIIMMLNMLIASFQLSIGKTNSMILSIGYAICAGFASNICSNIANR